MALPNTFATMAAGNVAAADLDANFTYLLNLINNLSGGGLRDYLAGLNLSNDSTTPNSVLDVSPGVAADSTNAVLISLGSIFYCSTGGSWSAGAGTSGSPVNKMGSGLTIADSTWYHVFAIINAGAADVYFDTSVTAANAPSGTTAFRRIGSFLTDSSAHILAFYQNGDDFYWGTPPAANVNATPPSTSATLASLTVPPGVVVTALLNGICTVPSSQPAFAIYLSSPNVADVAPSASGTPGYTLAFELSNANGNAGGQARVPTNTSQQIRYRAVGASGTDNFLLFTIGWTDTRGRYA